MLPRSRRRPCSACSFGGCSTPCRRRATSGVRCATPRTRGLPYCGPSSTRRPGYEATREPAARSSFSRTALRSAISRPASKSSCVHYRCWTGSVPPAAVVAANAEALINERWEREIAAPLIAAPRRRDAAALQLRGKTTDRRLPRTERDDRRVVAGRCVRGRPRAADGTAADRAVRGHRRARLDLRRALADADRGSLARRRLPSAAPL